jgi:hypothetical protein
LHIKFHSSLLKLSVKLFPRRHYAAIAIGYTVVDIGAAVLGCGVILSTQTMEQYVMESYREYLASANASSQLLRSIFGFWFPIFAPAPYNRLGYGWGTALWRASAS